ncbi:sulfotransferase, partial [Bacteroides thetaiotaomicron]|nr:sulfotransferase [Bacteroides thetaiotaomicron]
PVYTYLKRMLQFLQWQKARRGVAPAQRWLLKTPQHLHAIDVLCRVFPRAQVVLTHRDPSQTIPSMASMAHTLWQMYADDPDPLAVGAQ